MEYCELAVDIYTGCPHKCAYCYASASAKAKGHDFQDVRPRDNVIEETRAYLQAHAENMTGKTVFLGFSSDPYPTGYDASATTDMIRLLKEFGCHIMYCTKSGLTEGVRNDISLLDEQDSVGITISCGPEVASKYEPGAPLPEERLKILEAAHNRGCETWISLEPVLEADYILELLESDHMSYVSKVKLGKLNHMEIADITGDPKDNIDWKAYGEAAVAICDKRGIAYVVKKALSEKM